MFIIMTMTKIPEFLSKCWRPQQKLIHFINETKATTTTWWQWQWHELNTWRFDIPKITENINWHFTLHYSLCHCMITMYAYSIIISHLLLYSRFFTFFLCVSIPLCTQLPVWVQHSHRYLPNHVANDGGFLQNCWNYVHGICISWWLMRIPCT